MPHAPDSSQCPEWVARWVQETQGKQSWGFVQYTDDGHIREILAEEEHLYEDEVDEEIPRILEEYDRQVDKIVSSTHSAAGCDKSVYEQFELQDIAWPQSSIDQERARWNAEAQEARERDLDELDMLEDGSDDEELDLREKKLYKRDKNFLAKQKYLDKEEEGEFDDEARLRANFRVLRSHFKASRDLPRTSTEEGKEQGKEENEEGAGGKNNDDDISTAAKLHMGVLDNVFIVIDKACVDSQNTTSAWVYAVDPDYEDPGPTEPLSLKVKTKYRGFMRVRMVHLVNEFFGLRKYDEKDSSLKAFWRTGKKSGGGYFVPP